MKSCNLKLDIHWAPREILEKALCNNQLKYAKNAQLTARVAFDLRILDEDPKLFFSVRSTAFQSIAQVPQLRSLL